MVVSVITVRRAMDNIELDYLTQTVVSLDSQIRDGDHQLTTTMFICNTHPGPGNHDEALLLAKYFPMKLQFPRLDPDQAIRRRHEKQKDNYIYCLKQAMALNPKYILMVEDDVIPENNMMSILERTLKKIGNKSMWHTWAFLKLYYPERWQGYSVLEISRFIEILGILILGGYLYYVIFTCIEKKSYTSLSVCIACSMGALYSVSVALLVGRQNLMGWRRLSADNHRIVPAPDCCSPAVVYPFHMARGMAQYLEGITCNAEYPVDIAMDHYANQNNSLRYLIEPNLFKHIGMFSSLSAGIKNPEDFLF